MNSNSVSSPTIGPVDLNFDVQKMSIDTKPKEIVELTTPITIAKKADSLM